MYSPDTMLDRFASGSLETASGPRIVVMCFDRLDRDLGLALAAMDVGDHYETNAALGHAQDLVGELAGMVDIERWEHSGSLLSIYDYLLRRLAQANAAKHPAFVREAQRLVTEIGDGFRAAATERPADRPSHPAAEPAAGSGPDPDDRPRLSVQA